MSTAPETVTVGRTQLIRAVGSDFATFYTATCAATDMGLGAGVLFEQVANLHRYPGAVLQGSRGAGAKTNRRAAWTEAWMLSS